MRLPGKGKGPLQHICQLTSHKKPPNPPVLHPCIMLRAHHVQWHKGRGGCPHLGCIWLMRFLPSLLAEIRGRQGGSPKVLSATKVSQL